MTPDPPDDQIPRTLTGIPGLETITRGGLPTGRMTLVAGTSGSGKTLLAAQFLAAGIKDHGEPGVFVTVDQNAKDLLVNLSGLGWGLAEAVEAGQLIIIDASKHPSLDEVQSGQFDLSGLTIRLQQAIEQIGAKRVVIDAIGALAEAYGGAEIIRRLLMEVRDVLRASGVTSVITVERLSETQEEVSRWGLESFVADAMILLRNRVVGENRRRTIEIVKMRGATHQTGAVPFAIVPEKGLRVLPFSATPLDHPVLEDRVSTGLAALDEMFGGGVYRHAITLASGPPGVGNTLLGCLFAQAGLEAGDDVLYVSFEESKAQLIANARGIGLTLSDASEEGRLRIEAIYPETRSLEDHLLNIEAIVEEMRPRRLVLDSFDALGTLGTSTTFREFLIGLNSLVKDNGLTAWYTTSWPLLQPRSVIPARLATDADNLLLLQYVETPGMVDKALAVVKSRGSAHDPGVRGFTVDERGFHIGRQLHTLIGILGPHPRIAESFEREVEPEAEPEAGSEPGPG